MLSDVRIEAYRTNPNEHDLDLLALYVWNLALGESLYPVLQSFEIALRNTLNNAIGSVEGIRWYDSPDVLINPWARTKVTEAKQNLQREGKPLDPGRVVASLEFGVWTHLLNREYEQGPNRPPTQRPLWPRLTRTAFPYLPGTVRGRHDISRRFNAIRRLRNRVFHHEPIWSGRRVNPNQVVPLATQHAEVLEAIGWISPELAATVCLLDRFPAVHAAGTAPFRQQLEDYCRNNGITI